MRRWKRLLAFGVTAMVLLGNTLSAHAANVVEVPAEEVDSVYNQAVQSNEYEGWAKGPQIYSESGIVMDIDSGAILYAKNIDDQHYPASITKVLTALVALEHAELTDTVKFTWDDIGFLEYGDAHIGMKDGEEILMEDALYGMLLASANEVSHAIASNTAGGYEEFLELMNQTVKELGGMNSNFMNANGLHDPEHYTSARDMALIGAAAFQYDTFREITNTHQYTIPETNITDETRTFQQNHKMIWESHTAYYEYCVGGKTGFTDQALTTLVTFASKDGVNLVAVVLRTHGGGTNAYVDTRAMLDYGFQQFEKQAITTEQVANEQIASVSEGAYVMLPDGVTVDQLSSTFTSPTDFGDKVGTIEYSYMGQHVGAVEVTITEDYYNRIHGIEVVDETAVEENEDKADEKAGLPGFVKVILILVAVGIVGWIVLMIRINRKRRLMRRRRLEMRRRHKNKESII